MIPKKHHQLMMLVGLLLVFVVILAFEMRTTEPPPPAAATASPSNPVGRARGSAATSGANTAVTDVRLDALQRTGDGALGTTRNPFRFRPKPAPPPPRAVERTPPVTAPPVPTGPPPPPPIPLRFIGVLELQPRVAVFSSGRAGDPPLYGKEGDIIDGRYRVLRIGPESADLSYTDGRGRQTLRLSGQ